MVRALDSRRCEGTHAGRCLLSLETSSLQYRARALPERSRYEFSALGGRRHKIVAPYTRPALPVALQFALLHEGEAEVLQPPASSYTGLPSLRRGHKGLRRPSQ